MAQECTLRNPLPDGVTYKVLYDAFDELGDQYDSCADKVDFLLKAYNGIGK